MQIIQGLFRDFTFVKSNPCVGDTVISNKKEYGAPDRSPAKAATSCNVLQAADPELVAVAVMICAVNNKVAEVAVFDVLHIA